MLASLAGRIYDHAPQQNADPLDSEPTAMLRTLVVFAVLQAPVPSIAQTSARPIQRDSSDLIVLRAQLAEAKQFRSDILQTVNTSLATVGGVALLLIGFSWFANFRLLEREKSALEAQLKASLTTQESDLRQVLIDTASKELSALRREVQEAAKKQAEGVAAQLESFSSRLRELDERTRILARYRSYDVKLQEARYWQLQGVEGNEVNRYIDMLGLSLQLDDHGAISETLTNLIRLGDAGHLPFWAHVPGITANLEKLPPQYASEKQRLTDLMARVRRG